MATASPTAQPRKRRFRLQFSLRAFLIVATIIGIVLAPWIARTRQQMRVCEQLKSSGIYHELSDPPAWLQFLPTAWLNAAGGHWCRSIKRAGVPYDPNAIGIARITNLKNGIQLISQLPRLNDLSLDLRKLSASSDNLTECFSPLQRINGLQSLAIDTDQSDLVVTSLPSLPHLRLLQIQNYTQGITDDGLKQVAKFPELETLNVDGRLLQGRTLNTVASLKRLKNVMLEGSMFNSSDLGCFANHPALETLNPLSFADDETVRILSSCPNMRAIILSNSHITDKSLSHLQQLRNLQEIHLDGTQITDSGFAHLAACKSLKTVLANMCNLSDAIGPTLSQLFNLEALQLDSTHVTEDLLPHLSDLMYLNAMSLPDVSIDSNKIVDFISNQSNHENVALTNLSWGHVYYHFGSDSAFPATNKTFLDFTNIRGISYRIHQVHDLASVTNAKLTGSDIDDSGLQVLTRSCNLERLDLSRTAVTPAGLKSLHGENSLTWLRAGPFENADQAFQAIGSVASLTALELTGIDRLTDAHIASITKLQNLTSLKIYGCEADPKSFNSLCQLPKLKGLVWGRKNQYDTFDIENDRLQVARDTIGVPQGFQSRIPALNAAMNPYGGSLFKASSFGHTPIIIADERELSLLGQTRLRSLSVANLPLTPQGAKTLLSHPGLNDLDLTNTDIDDEILKTLSNPWLDSLMLSKTPITDAAVDTILRFRSLQHLSLANTAISDAGLSRIIQSMGMQTLDLSGTSITAQAWSGLNPNNFPVAQELTLTDVAALPEILSTVPRSLLPRWIIVNRDRTTIEPNTLAVLRKELPAPMMESIQISPELLKCWSAEEMLHGKTHLKKLHLCRTDAVAQILSIASSECPNLVALEFRNESFNTSNSPQSIPPRIQLLSFDNCVISTSVLKSLANCSELMHLSFLSCNFDGCDLALLRNIASLRTLTRESTTLTAEQLQTWNSLQSTLIPSESP